MSLRDKWSVKLPATQVAAQARMRAEHHRGRQAFWAEQLATAEQELRAHGLEFRELPVTGGNKLQAVMDPGRVDRVEECRRKVIQHERQAADYEAYRILLDLLAIQNQGTMYVDLDSSDVVYFGL